MDTINHIIESKQARNKKTTIIQTARSQKQIIEIVKVSGSTKIGNARPGLIAYYVNKDNNNNNNTQGL